MTSHSPPTLLLTGAAGVLGHALVEQLARDFRIIALRGSRPVAHLAVTELVGDLTEPCLGLSDVVYDRLAGQVDVVVHAAAMTKWTADPALLHRINVTGTATMLQLAADAKAPLYYVSTAFVVREAPTDPRFAGLAAYLESKVAAERLVRESAVPTTILRPSVVIGDSRDGRMAAFQGWHRMLGRIVRGTLPILPADEGALIDAVPQDVVAEAVAGLVRDRVTSAEVWLTAGTEALVLSDVVDLGGRLARELGIPVHRPRFVPFESVDRLLLPLLGELLDEEQQREFVDFLQSVWVFQAGGALPSDLGRLGFGGRVDRAALIQASERSMTYWAAAKGLVPPAAAPALEAA